jgi:hypothetical protein
VTKSAAKGVGRRSQRPDQERLVAVNKQLCVVFGGDIKATDPSRCPWFISQRTGRPSRQASAS